MRIGAARRAESASWAGSPTCADSTVLRQEMPSAALHHSWSNTVTWSHRSESSGIDMPRMRSSSGLPKSSEHLLGSLHLMMRICITTSRRARTVLSTCSMSMWMLASEPRALTVSETPGLMGPAGASANSRRVVISVMREAELGTVHPLGLPAGEPEAPANRAFSARGLALMAGW